MDTMENMMMIDTRSTIRHLFVGGLLLAGVAALVQMATPLHLAAAAPAPGTRCLGSPMLGTTVPSKLDPFSVVMLALNLAPLAITGIIVLLAFSRRSTADLASLWHVATPLLVARVTAAVAPQHHPPGSCLTRPDALPPASTTLATALCVQPLVSLTFLAFLQTKAVYQRRQIPPEGVPRSRYDSDAGDGGTPDDVDNQKGKNHEKWRSATLLGLPLRIIFLCLTMFAPYSLGDASLAQIGWGVLAGGVTGAFNCSVVNRWMRRHYATAMYDGTPLDCGCGQEAQCPFSCRYNNLVVPPAQNGGCPACEEA